MEGNWQGKRRIEIVNGRGQGDGKDNEYVRA